MNKEMFKEELSKLGIVLTKEMENKLEYYYELLIESNKVMNLTAITEKEEVYLKHFYDSLTAIKGYDLTENLTLCDVGTGAGFPGLILKIVFPNLKVTLVDSLEKRTKFLEEVIEKLELIDIYVYHARMENYFNEVNIKYDIVIARAVAKTNILLELCSQGVKTNGILMLMKGNTDKEVLDAKNAERILGFKLLKGELFNLPVEESIRTLLVYLKEKETNKIYPRHFSKISKKPL